MGARVRQLAFALVAAALAGGVLSSAAAAATTPSTVTGSNTVFIAVTSPCTGEHVEVLQDMRFVAHLSDSEHGNILQVLHLTSAGATATGLTTGDTYQVVDIALFRDDFSSAPFDATLILRQQFIGRGNGDNFVLDWHVHFTVDANGQLHADINKINEGRCMFK